MPRYFFHIHDGHDFPDETGTELRSLREAQLEVVRLTSDLLKDETVFWQGEGCSIDVADSQGVTLLAISFTASDQTALSQSRSPRAVFTLDE